MCVCVCARCPVLLTLIKCLNGSVLFRLNITISKLRVTVERLALKVYLLKSSTDRGWVTCCAAMTIAHFYFLFLSFIYLFFHAVCVIWRDISMPCFACIIFTCVSHCECQIPHITDSCKKQKSFICGQISRWRDKLKTCLIGGGEGLYRWGFFSQNPMWW